MSLLKDYAITPDVFKTDSYLCKGSCENSRKRLYRRSIYRLFDMIRSHGVIRNLREGEWLDAAKVNIDSLDTRTDRLLRKMERRSVQFKSQKSDHFTPSNDKHWLEEAIKTMHVQKFNGGIITAIPFDELFKTDVQFKELFDEFREKHRNGAQIRHVRDLLGGKSGDLDWWPQSGSPSIYLSKDVRDYKENLFPIFRYANYVHLVDPHIKLEQLYNQGKKDIGNMILGFGNGIESTLRITIHTSKKALRGVNFEDEKKKSQRELSAALRQAKVKSQIDVFVWKDFHDRYLISDLIGIVLPHGFYAPGSQDSIGTTWTRLKETDREHIESKFGNKRKDDLFKPPFTIPNPQTK